MNWGRIFFHYNANGRLCDVQGQPLENHVGNSHIILEQFQSVYFNAATREQLLIAAQLHDEGKKMAFRIIDNHQQAKNKEKQKQQKTINGDRFGYSFAGHRFHVPGKGPYIDGLIRSHHEFSVEQINREKSKLCKEEKRHFADDLYLLCMADQLEAELAVKSVEQKHGDISRTFMEFATRRIAGQPQTFTVVPWPFVVEHFTLNLLLLRPELSDMSTASAFKIQKAFENGVNFEEQNVTITLRRD
jgi:CRISPR-associated endonuclease/helicase Cas3